MASEHIRSSEAARALLGTFLSLQVQANAIRGELHGSSCSRELAMGVCLSCCGGREKDKYDEHYVTAQTTTVTERDMEARLRAAEQAEARQQQFQKSPVGRAAYRSVQEAKRPEPRTNPGPTAQDWLS